MKSSRSVSTKITRRNARRFNKSDSSDDSDDVENVDSARAEKVFSRRRLRPTSNNENTFANKPARAGKLFELSSTSDSESPHGSQKNSSKEMLDSAQRLVSIGKKVSNVSYTSVENSFAEKNVNRSLLGSSENDTNNESFFPKKCEYKQRAMLNSSSESDVELKSSKKVITSLKNDVNDYRRIPPLSSDDDISNASSESKRSSILLESDQSVEDGVLEEIVDKSPSGSSENSTNHESCIITPKKLGNRQKIISDSSSESDVELKGSKKVITSLKNDVNDYRRIPPLSSDDDISNASSEFKRSSILLESNQSVENGAVKEIVDKSLSGSPENSTNHESCIITPKEFRNKQRLISDSSSESDVELTSSKKSVKNETILVLDSDSDGIVNSSNEIIPMPTKKHEESNVVTKLEDLSLIECSDSDNDISEHYKSTISSSKQSRPFFESSVIANSVRSPLSQSSILENVNFVAPENTSNILQNKKSIDVINLDEYFPKSAKVSSSEFNPTLIDLTKDEFGVSNKNSVMSSNVDSLKIEKTKLEELMKQYTSNINNIKNTKKTANLQLLPDKGLKLETALHKNEILLKDTKMQLNNILKQLEHFPPEKLSQPQSAIYPVKSTNIENALTKKAAANIDINAMGDKALNTYRTQQVMTLDVLNSLHKSLETCPSLNTLSEDPKGLKVELMTHQKYAISWLMWREKQKPHGGVLADDMGLGKTLTMISLILKDSEKLKEAEKEEDSDFEDLDYKPSISIKGGTLIICPSSLISQWQNEIKTKVRSGIIDVVQHYGPNRETSARRLARKDVVITTYNVVMWDQKNHQNTSPIFQIKWNRIILDEAHAIRNYKSQTSVAVSNIMGINRWALSGTPVHNKEADFYALLKFIKCRPFDDWAVWKRWVGNNDQAGKNRLSLLVKTLMLRRTKAELSELTTFSLPQKTFHTINVELFKEEKAAYEKVLLFSSSLFSSYLYEKAEKENAIQGGFSLKNKINYKKQQNLDDNVFKDHPELDRLFKQFKSFKDIKAHHILVLILRLRQLCCHPCLMKNLLETETLKDDGIQDTGDLDLIDTMSRMSIGVPSIEKPTLSDSNPIFKDSWLSSKIKAVCNMVEEKILHTEDKAVIVSQWPSMLILIGKQLSRYNVKTELFSGAVPIPLRNKLVEDFNNLKGGPKVLLLSLTAGGVGLNLVAANHLFLVDIHWNPQLEAQACDRIYRVGQTKPVNIYKFICTNTIETSIKAIQDSKLTIANNLFGGCNNIESSKITLEELKQIFQINK